MQKACKNTKKYAEKAENVFLFVYLLFTKLLIYDVHGGDKRIVCCSSCIFQLCSINESDFQLNMNMKRILAIVMLVVVCVAGVSAQNTKANGRKLFNEGRFQEAKPIFKVLLGKSPKSAEYNYWYAACCYETNDTLPGIERMLAFAEEKKVLNAPYYLARIHSDNYDYPAAIDAYERFLKEAKDEERIEYANEELDKIKELLRMMKSTERLCVVDSFVVDKSRFLDVYHCGRDAGKLFMSADYFSDDSYEGVLAMTERGTDIYFQKAVKDDTLQQQKIFHSSKNGSEWSVPVQIKGFDTEGNDAYPFMSADGSTFYFASDGKGSIGGYDIFVTRYDSEEGRFLLPTNVGMPYNSTANDYMLVINEIANLGWFATDRRMPQDKVCIYVFIPNVRKDTYNYEVESYDRILSYAWLNSIADTHNNGEAVRRARQQLTMLIYEDTDDDNKGDFTFILDDMTDYHTLRDFRSNEAREMFQEWRVRTVQYVKELGSLEAMRLEYAGATLAQKQRMAPEIRMQEAKLEKECESLLQMEKEIRIIEYKELNR